MSARRCAILAVGQTSFGWPRSIPVTRRSSPPWAALAAMMGMAVLFGASFVASKIALATISPAQLIFLRFLIAAVVFTALARVLPWERLDRSAHLKIFALALLEPGIYFFLEAEGIRRTLASTAAILISTIPVFVLVLEGVWLQVRVKGREVVLVALSLCGIGLLLTGGIEHAIGGSLAGNLLILGAALAASVYTVLAHSLLARHSPVTVTRLQALWAVAIYLPFAVHDTFASGIQPVGGRTLAAIAYLGLGCSTLAYWLLNYALSRVKATAVAAFTNVIPVVGTALAVALLGERLFAAQVVGAVIVVASVTTLTLWRPEIEEPSTIQR